MRKKIVIAAVSLMAVMFIGTIAGFLNFAPKSNNMKQDPTDPEATINKLFTPVSVNASALGDKNANITIVEFA
ncbi:MAG TPA: hypothetical protein VFV86_04165, partial [Nitrososphaeraceae archaeon]|nr:hypothetical protein [Nitrososphaeraceae archaeon]